MDPFPLHLRKISSAGWGEGEDLNESLVLENDRVYVPRPWGLNSLNRSKGATLLIVAKKL